MRRAAAREGGRNANGTPAGGSGRDGAGIGTNRPIFCGRDGVIRYSLAEIEREARSGYAWHGTWPLGVLRDCDHGETGPGRQKQRQPLR